MPLTRYLILILLTSAIFLIPSAGTPPPDPASPETQAELSAAFEHRLDANREAYSLTFELFTPELDTAFISPDGEHAVLWLALRDHAGRILGTEPGLALARLTEVGWEVLLPGDVGWEETLAALPDRMIPAELSPAPEGAVNNPNAPDALTGYYLPYAAGTSHFLEGSISHFQYIPELGYPSCSITYCHYAYDFTDVDHYPLLASKSGTVVDSYDGCTDGSPTCTNYIVLYNAGDQAYQIYLHFSHATIPDALTPGTFVERGQYLGDTDDTGYSTSQHVHFMVTNSIWMSASGYYWGQSVDIRFADVAINNGIPRNCVEVTQFPIYDGATECLGDKSDPHNPANDWFVSGNVGAFPPTGAMTQPVSGAMVASGTDPMMHITANVFDDVRVTAATPILNLNGEWVDLGPQLTPPVGSNVLDWDVDLCAVAPLNGPVEIALRVTDYERNTAVVDPHTIQVDHACPPPTSQLMPAETFDSTAARLTWDATEAGAGLGSFELQWRPDPGSWDNATTLLLPSPSRATWFAGDPGASYAFRLRAVDMNGQAESWPEGGAVETYATLPITCTPDNFEPDDDMTQAVPLAVDEWAQRNLCAAGNPDWFQVELAAAGDYFVVAPSQGGGAAVKITVYDQDGQTVLTTGQAAGVGESALVRFQAPLAGVYFIKIEPLTPSLMGTQALYGVRVTEVKEIFLPEVRR